MRIKRGKRKSLVVEMGRYRLRVVPGRFRWHFTHNEPGIYVASLRLFLVTVYVRQRPNMSAKKKAA